MGFAELEKSVLTKAQSERDKILADAKTTVDEIAKENKKLIEEFRKKSNEETKRLIEAMEMREVASARLEAKKKILLAKKELIEEVFTKVKENLRKKLTAAEKKKLLDSLIAKAKSEIDVGTIFCSSEDTALIPNSKPKDMIGGIIAESKDKTTLVDLSFETLIDDIKEQKIREITEQLFK